MRVAVLMGGPSPEHNVSLDSGIQVCLNLDLKKYSIKPIIVTKEGWWRIPNGFYTKPLKETSAENLILKLDPETPALPLGTALTKLIEEEIEVAFIIIHGPFGEDGILQGCLEAAGITYTGSGVLGSVLAIDKLKSREIYTYHKIPVPKFIVVKQLEWVKDQGQILSIAKSEIGFPMVVKPTFQGSSVGISIVEKDSQLTAALKLAFSYGEECLIDEFIQGKELTCGVLESSMEGVMALPVTEIIPKVSTFFDYAAKYKAGGSEEITPAKLDPKITKMVQDLAILSHQVLRCGGFSRTDFILKNGVAYTLETNTLPGMTATSLIPQAAKAAGISFSQMLDKIISHALENKDQIRNRSVDGGY